MSASAAKLTSFLTRNLEWSKTYKAPGKLLDCLTKAKAAGRTGTVIISCSDPRITPKDFLGLEIGEAAIIRNPGGRAHEALNSILALDAVGRTGLVLVVHHTNCGMSHNTEQQFHDQNAARHPEIDEGMRGHVWGAISDPEVTVAEDVAYLSSRHSRKTLRYTAAFSIHLLEL